jgi:nucleoprotein TPR
MKAAHAAELEKAAANTQAAIDAALAKQRSELKDDAEATARHAEELRGLEERLKRQHQEELARAVEAAKTATPASPDQQAAIESAVTARVQELQAKHEEEISAAVERGRMEASAKTKLKDGQLVRVQARCKELEAQLAQLKTGGAAAPAASPTAGTSKPAPPTQAGKATPGTAAAPKPAPGNAAAPKPAPGNAATAAANAAAAAARPTGLPQKPGAAAPPGAGRGRGAVRGAARGAAPGGLAIRGSAATPPATTPTPAAGPSDGVSIIGAASKRPREEGEATEEDSLAKRLKPEGATKPVQLQRNRVPPQPPSAPS